jgi:hypothetical protein
MLAGGDDPPAAEQAALPQAEQEMQPEATETPTLEANLPTAEPAAESSPA